MNKTLLTTGVAFCVLIILLLAYNFLNKCSEYGGFVGVIKRCDCVGWEINHPLDSVSSQMPGGSSTMCVGVQTSRQ